MFFFNSLIRRWNSWRRRVSWHVDIITNLDSLSWLSNFWNWMCLKLNAYTIPESVSPASISTSTFSRSSSLKSLLISSLFLLWHFSLVHRIQYSRISTRMRTPAPSKVPWMMKFTILMSHIPQDTVVQWGSGSLITCVSRCWRRCAFWEMRRSLRFKTQEAFRTSLITE